MNKRSILKKAMSKKYCDATRFEFLDPDERIMIYRAMETYKKERKPKRKPDSNGVLPLTDEELAEFSCLFYECRSIDIIKVVPRTNSIKIYFVRPNLTFELDAIFTENYKAILYLAERFELEVK